MTDDQVLAELAALRTEIQGLKATIERRSPTPAERAAERQKLIDFVATHFDRFGYFVASRTLIFKETFWIFLPVSKDERPAMLEGFGELLTPAMIRRAGIQVIDRELPGRLGRPEIDPVWKAAARVFRKKWGISDFQREPIPLSVLDPGLRLLEK